MLEELRQSGMVTWHMLCRVATSVGSFVFTNLYEGHIQVFKFKRKKVQLSTSRTKLVDIDMY